MSIQFDTVHKYHEPPKAKYREMNANLKKIPKIRSSDRWYHDRENRKVLYVLLGSFCGVVIIGAIFAIPIVLTIKLNKTADTTTTQSTLSNTSTNASNMTVTTNAPNMTVITTTAMTTNTATTTVCPNMTCTFSSIASPMTSTYGVEHLDINCTQSVSNMAIVIVVQRSVNASYANQYQTFWNLTTNQSYIETNSQIIYTWTLLTGQIVTDIGFPYFVEGQYNLPNVNQTTSLDTYSATLTSVCGHTISQSGTF